MSNPTANFGWQMPTATDLVTDLPADFEVFGQAVDTSLAELKGGTTGQVLSKASNTDMDFTWVTSDDANAIQNAIVDAKGDLIAASANDTPARLAVGNNGEVLIADSSTATGLRYQGNFAAGKNKIINGDFGIWQRGTSFSNPASGSYLADRFVFFSGGSGVTRTISQQTFTPGTAPVAGYEGKFFFRFNQSVAGTGDTFNQVQQKIEDVQTFAGQTVTFSFWAKAATTTVLPLIRVSQNFGSGGSGDVNVDLASSVSISTGWTRYSYTAAIPSISGKTVGTSSSLVVSIWLPVNATFTFDTWGWQVEAGSVATAFQTATGTIQGELAACQRYYWRTSTPNATAFHGTGSFSTSTNVHIQVQFPTVMRIVPTSLDFSNVTLYNFSDSNFAVSALVIASAIGSGNSVRVDATTTGGTAGVGAILVNSSSSGYVGFSAEL